MKLHCCCSIYCSVGEEVNNAAITRHLYCCIYSYQKVFVVYSLLRVQYEE